jgi:hypothetical protein
VGGAATGATAGVGGAVAAGGGFGIGSLIHIIVLIGLGGIGIFVGGVLVGAILIFTGDPAACVNRKAVADPAQAAQLTKNWDAFSAKAAAGSASITITEQQATARGVQWVAEKDAPLSDLQVYFCPDGHAEAKGTASYLGRDVNIVVEGTLDLTAAKPTITVDAVRAGNLPSAVGTRIVNIILNAGDLKTLPLKEHLTSVSFSDGQAVIEGTK